MKENKRTVILTTLVCLIPVIAGIILYPQLPATMVTHWNAQGEPNGWQSKFVAAIVFPGSLALLSLLMPALLKMDPKYNNVTEKAKNLILWIIPAVTLFASSGTLAEGLGMHANVKVTAPVFMGLLFVIIGNYLPKMKQTYTVGIKIPWTLASEENWNRTHRIAGFIWVIGGVVVIVGSLLLCRAVIFTVVLICLIAIPAVYSYLLYKKGV